jgi:hypothetical protein
MSFSKNLAYGKAAESAIARWMISRGASILPVYEKIIDEGKGPQLFTACGAFVAPDILAMKAGKFKWIEAKHKKAFSWYRKKSVFETGIDLRHYEEYQKVQDISGTPVWLLFLHEGGCAKDSPESPSGLFGARLDELRVNESHRSDKWGSGGMVYWCRDCDGGPLRKIAELEDVLATAPAP